MNIETPEGRKEIRAEIANAVGYGYRDNTSGYLHDALDALDQKDERIAELERGLAAAGELTKSLSDKNRRIVDLEERLTNAQSYRPRATRAEQEVAKERALRTSLEESLAAEQAECERLRRELDWQNIPNRGPVRGGHEFYINEEWTYFHGTPIDQNIESLATLRKIRTDPNDDRVRVRLVVDDDALLADIARLTKRAEARCGDCTKGAPKSLGKKARTVFCLNCREVRHVDSRCEHFEKREEVQ